MRGDGVKPVGELLTIPKTDRREIPCDRCGKSVISVFKVALCPGCYEQWQDELQKKSNRENALDLDLWRHRKTLARDDEDADRRFMRSVTDKSFYRELLWRWTTKRIKGPGKAPQL